MLWAMTRAVVLLRGINVGGHNRIKMAALTAVLEGIGCSDVVTYLQSGNAVVTTGLTPARLEAATRAALVKEGLDVAVLVRTAKDLDVVVAGLPFAGEELNPKLLHVAFLSGPVDASVLPSDADAAPDRVRAGQDRCLYIDYAKDLHSSKLATRMSDKKLGVSATARNWRTVLALQELLHR